MIQPYFRFANRLLLTPYISGAIFGLIAGMLNPNARALILISAVAASLGGASGLAWIPQFLRDDSSARAGFQAPPGSTPFDLPRQWGWIILGALTAVLVISVLGPGMRFRQ